MKKIAKRITLVVVVLVVALAAVAGAFLAVRSIVQQREKGLTDRLNQVLSECAELSQTVKDVAKEKLEMEREAKIYQTMYEIEDMKASILASRYVKIECSDTRTVLGKEYFSYQDVYFVRFYFAYTDDFKVADKGDAIEISYSEKTFFAPYSIESRYVNQNLVAGLVMTIEEDDHIVEIVKSISDSQASEVENLLISRLVKESKEKGVGLVVNGTPIEEWTEDCKLYHETLIPEFDGYTVTQLDEY